MTGRLLVIAHHIMWTTYGSWFPNDLRGSTSSKVLSDALQNLGVIHYGRKKVQPSRTEFKAFLTEARSRLKFPWLEFKPSQFPLVAQSLAEVVAREKYTVYACAIMPDHAHLVIRKHKHGAEEMISNFQESSRLRLSNPLRLEPNHPVWTTNGFTRFIDSPDSVRSRINYVNRNPIKAHLPAQHWPFVTPLRQLAPPPRPQPQLPLRHATALRRLSIIRPT